ncbi:hypothetical protein [Microbacterium sp. A94]|uniref:hypothetical protein n=1 Tax=Microbacterium sp. A94 TaxID=3450717 RepID=UPI003F4359B6
MESAALWISFVSAAAAIGTTVIAWTSRADSITAQGRAEKAEEAALAASRDAVEAHRIAASALSGINAYLVSEPDRARRRAACFGVLDAFFNLVSLPGQGRDMWHSPEHLAFIDAEKQALFDLGSKSQDSRGLRLTREAFEILRDKQTRGLWDESVCSRLKGVIGHAWEDASTESKSEEWWAERRVDVLSAK